jgi:hypothetical protein
VHPEDNTAMATATHATDARVTAARGVGRRVTMPGLIESL